MSSVGILVTPQMDSFSPPPQAGANDIIVRDYGRSHQLVSSPSLTSSSAQSSKQANLSGQSGFSHISSESTQTTSTEPTNDETSDDGCTSGKAPYLHLIAVCEEDVQTFGPRIGMNMSDGHIGPPPPSPPASVEREIELTPTAGEDEVRSTDERGLGYAQPDIRLVTSSPCAIDADKPRVPPISPQPSSSAITPVVASASTTTSQPWQPSRASSSHSPHLQPPGGKTHRVRPTRRNTTPAAAAHAGPSTQSRAQSSSRFAAADDGMVVGRDINLGSSPDEKELASEIQQAAEQIRRERLSKRAKQQAQQAEHEAVEAALSRTDTRRSAGSGKEDVVLVGNLIGEGHVNYVLMYNMLTGIRVGVSRCQAKLKRALTPEDFCAAHKMSFDIMGNELTPSAKYDFKFKDYAPWVFRSLREDVFHLDPADYLLSLTARYILSELGSPGKSGSFFYFSRDYRFIIKTIRHAEHKFLLSILEKYYKHAQSNPHTLLSRFYGLHRVKLPRGRKIHFVIMNNLFPPHRDIHETYDLKGSTVGREYPEEKARQNPRAVLKDLNWINRGKMLELGPEKRALLTEQIRRDAEFLKTINVMDYSLLVGIHNMRRGNRDNVRKNTLKVFSPDIPRRHRKTGSAKGLPADAALVRRAMRHSQTKSLGEGKNTIKLPDEDMCGYDRSHLLFYQDEAGLRATDESNDPESTIYYLGIIDILTPWTMVKKVEGIWKGLSADRHKISPVPPAEYSQRFFNFMKAIMRGGEGGQKFKAD